MSEIFLEISSLVFASLERDTFIEKVSNRITKKFCDFFYMVTLNSHGSMELRISQGERERLGPEVLQTLQLKLIDRDNRQGPASVIRSASPEIVSLPKKASNENNTVYQELMKELGMSSSVSAPLVADNEVLGCVGFMNQSFSAELGREDLVILEEIARPVSMALRNAKLHNKIKESEQKLSAIANAVPAPIAYVNELGEITYCNHGFTSFFGVCPQGALLKDVLPKEVNKTLEGHIKSALRGEAKKVESRFYCPEKGLRLLEISLTPRGDKEADRWFLVYIQDLTEIKKNQLELKKSKEEADAANLAKSRFLTNMSHEIRTPLGSILGFTELLTNFCEDIASMKEYGSKIQRCGNHLLEIINNVLDLAKAEENKITINPKEFNFNDFYEELSDSFPSKEVALSFNSEISEELVIKTDKTVLRQILYNLIGNAIKFSSKGEVRVLAEYEKAGSYLNFFIEDSGPGISSEQSKKLFMPFSQIDSTDRRKHEGTGLGLVLARKMARALGGEVELYSSEIGVGSIFKISVQVDKFESAKKVEASLSPNYTNVERLKGAQIMVIDDSQDFRFLISSFFQLLGANVECYSSGQEALEGAFLQSADIAFLDLQMPEMDGYAVKRELKNKGFKKPIIACTANAMEEDLDKILTEGFSGYITKPLEMDNLIATALEHY